MGAGKVLAIIFVILILIVGIIGVDIYLTYNSLSNADLSTAVSNIQYDISSDNSTITLSVDVALPSGGFIPKGVIIALTVDFAGDEQTKTEMIDLGDAKTISIDFEMTQSNIDTLANGGSLTVALSALVTPTVFGFAINQVAQEVDLGSQSISV